MKPFDAAFKDISSLLDELEKQPKPVKETKKLKKSTAVARRRIKHSLRRLLSSSQVSVLQRKQVKRTMAQLESLEHRQLLSVQNVLFDLAEFEEGKLPESWQGIKDNQYFGDVAHTSSGLQSTNRYGEFRFPIPNDVPVTIEGSPIVSNKGSQRIVSVRFQAEDTEAVITMTSYSHDWNNVTAVYIQNQGSCNEETNKQEEGFLWFTSITH